MGSNFHHILVPVDFTAKNDAAIRVAQDMAEENQAVVTLLHVIETVEYADDQEIRRFYEMLDRKAQKRLEALVGPLIERGVSVESAIEYGRRGPEIVRFALEHKTDLIVLSSHAIDVNDPAAAWTTLSYQVSIVCHCPVLLVK